MTRSASTKARVGGGGGPPPDACFHERVVALDQLPDPLLPTLEIGGEPGLFTADGRPSLRRQIAAGLFPRPHDRLADPHFQLPEQAVTGRRIEVGTAPDFVQCRLEQIPGLVRIDRQ